jgi:transcription elongation GreA/GreB family factor
VKEADYAGVTALLNSMKAAVTAHTTAHNADLVAASAQASVDKLDVDSSEAAALAAVKTAGAFTTTPTYTQAVQKDVDLKAAADAETVGTTAHDAYTAYHTKFAIYDTAYKANPLYDAHTDAQAAVDADVEAISDFNDALAALTTAQQHAADLAGYQATIDAATSVFAANDYNLVMLDDTALTTQVATASSDVYVVDADSANTSISLFGSQGTDSISIGTGFTLNTGKLSTGNDAVKEVFIAQSGTNTVIQVETSVFGSNAATPEVVKITLVGVTATDVHLDANGIISVGSPTA